MRERCAVSGVMRRKIFGVESTGVSMKIDFMSEGEGGRIE